MDYKCLANIIKFEEQSKLQTTNLQKKYQKITSSETKK